MKKNKKVRPFKHPLRHALLVSPMLIGALAHAGDAIEFDSGWTMNWAVTTSYGVGMRLHDPASALLGANSDDGNRNFDRHSLITNRVGALAEMQVYKGLWGAALRASTFYDDVYHSKNDNDSPATLNRNGGDNDEFSSDAKYYAGGRSRILDAYVFGGLRFDSGMSADFKAGRHVESWGEGFYYQGVNGAQSPSDAVKASQPGVEVKEVLLPVGQVSGTFRITEDFSLAGYIQYEWKGTELSPVGSFMSTFDGIGPGREFMFAGPARLNYAGKKEASDSGQWGIATRWRPSDDMELMLFHIRYHDKNPTLYNDLATMTYRVGFVEDIKMSGVSISTRLGNFQVAGEYSYRDGMGMTAYSNTGSSAVSTGSGHQLQVSSMYILGNTPWASATTLTGEIVHQRAEDVDDVVVGGAVINQLTHNSASAWKTRSATHYTVGAVLSYPGVFPGWDLDVPMSFAHYLDGSSAMSGVLTGAQGDRRYSVGTTFKYLGNFEVAMKYNAYEGKADPIRRPLADRDHVTLALKYSF